MADGFIPPYEYDVQKVTDRTFRDGRVIYLIAYSGGDIGSCRIPPEAEKIYPLGSSLLIHKTRILGKCTVAPLPEGWTLPAFD